MLTQVSKCHQKNDSKLIQITNLTISNAEQNIELSLGARRESQSPFKKGIFEQTHLRPTHSRKKSLKTFWGCNSTHSKLKFIFMIIKTLDKLLSHDSMHQPNCYSNSSKLAKMSQKYVFDEYLGQQQFATKMDLQEPIGVKGREMRQTENPRWRGHQWRV